MKTREEYRMDLWTRIAEVVARAENSVSKTAPAAWANQVLADFDRTFPPDSVKNLDSTSNANLIAQ